MHQNERELVSRSNMFSYLRVRNHKAVNRIQLDSLGQINVLFGKNNSGKTSIVEAINRKECVAVGKPLDNIEPLVQLFSQEASQYFDNVARKATKAFRSYLEKLRENGAIWYFGEEEEIIQSCASDLEGIKELQHLDETFNMTKILNTWFQDIESTFQPVLIPPKRKLEAFVPINLEQKIENYGAGIVNHLFFLKNQNPTTNEHEVYKQIYTAFSEISDYEFNVIPDTKNNVRVFFRHLEEEKWIPSDDSGLGLADLLIMITFALGTAHSVICLEEPESHLHPEMQKRFLTFLKGIEHKQIILSTHSSIFLNPSMTDRIFYVQLINNEVVLADETDNAQILFNLGYSISDHLIADAIVLVENAPDIPVLKTVLNWVGLDRRFNINYFPLNGDVRTYLDLSIFARRQNVVALTFSRGDTEVATTRFYGNCEKIGIAVWRLQRSSIENYFSLEALRKIFDSEVPDEVQSLKPHISVDAQLGFSLNHKSVKVLNSEIIAVMDPSDLKDTDLLQFCNMIKDVLQDKPDIELKLEDPENLQFIEANA